MAKHLLHLEGLLTERQVRAAATAASSEAQHAREGKAAGPFAGSSMEVGSCSKWQPLASSAEEVGSRSAGSGPALWMPLADSTGDVLGAALCCPQAGQAAAGRRNKQDSKPLSSRSSSGSRPGGGGGGGFLRPIYVSAGHRVSLATALAVVACCCRHRCALCRAGRSWGCSLLPLAVDCPMLAGMPGHTAAKCGLLMKALPAAPVSFPLPRVPEPIRQADLLSRAEVRRRLQQGDVQQLQQGSSQS